MDPSSPDLPAVDSTAKLLQDLHLLERKSRNRHGEYMDTMDMDVTLEVPGTPDRLAETACPVEDLGEEAAGQAFGRSCSNLSLHGEGASSSNVLNNESLFRQARLASLISKPRNVRLNHVGKKSPLGIFHPTKWSDWRKLNLDLHAENEASSYDCLNSVEYSPSGSIKRTNYGFADSLELSGGAREKEMNEIVVAGVGSEHRSMNRVSECNCNENRLSSLSDSQTTSEKAALKPYSGRFGRRRLVRHALISPSNIKGTFPSLNGEPSSSYVERTAVDKGKGIDFSNNSQHKSEHAVFQQHQFDIPQKNSGKRRMEWNGCIPSSNTAKDGNLTDRKREGIHKLDFRGVRDDCSSCQLHVVSPDSERRADEVKEQVFLNDGLHAKGPNAKSSVMSSRELLFPGKERTISADLIADIWPAGNISLRTTHTGTVKGARLSSHEPSVVSNRKNNQHEKTVVEGINMNTIRPHLETCSLEAAGSSSCPNETHTSQAQGSTEIKFVLNSEDGGHCGAEGLTRGKRKSGSCHTLLGECSCSAITEIEVSHPESSVQPIRGCSSRCHGVRLGPVIDCDELPSPGLRDTSDHGGNCISSEESVARALQVESDEIMARQLQEQFFNEPSDFGGAEEEIDATIAWSLQEEEDAQHASLTRNHGRSFPRNPSIAHLYQQYPSESSQNPSVWSTSHARFTSSGRMSQSRRNVRREEDLEARLNFLEALELTFNNGNDVRSDILHVHRDFNEGDYEMLLALDDDNHQHMGASDRQINSLPQTVIQADNAEEACAICLEHPSVGDTVRHLPCLHKFHKDCIDTWLRRRTSCPICKSTIT